MNRQISDEPLADKTVLEVGCGLGRTTRTLVTLLSGQPGAKLIVTDLVEQYLEKTRSKLGPTQFKPLFIKTDACDLAGIDAESVDYVVCNFALCEINSETGRGTLALARFFSVLKPGGKVFIEEEFPISAASGPAQQAWARMWRVFKSALMFIQKRPPSSEYQPEVLRRVFETIGFTDVEWEASVRTHGLDWLEPRITQLEKYMPGYPSPQIGQMYIHLAKDIRSQAQESGKIEIPIYSLSAIKPL